jgi:hypothetical protein
MPDSTIFRVGDLVLWNKSTDFVYGHPISEPMVVLTVWKPEPAYPRFRYKCWSFHISDWFIVEEGRMCSYVDWTATSKMNKLCD